MARHSHARFDRSGFDLHVLIVGLILLILGMPQTMKAASALRVGENGRYLVEPDGKPLFWLGDTAWLLSQMTTREDMDLYLRTRALQGFTVIQAGVVMGEERVGGTLRANIYGDMAFANSGLPRFVGPVLMRGFHSPVLHLALAFAA